MNNDRENYWNFFQRTTETSRKYIRVQTAIQLGCYLAGLIESELPRGSRLRTLAHELEAEIVAYLETEYRSGVEEMRKAAEGVRERILKERPLVGKAEAREHDKNVMRWQMIKETRRAPGKK